MSSKLSELVLDMCLAYTDTSAYRPRRVSRISLSRNAQRCRVLNEPGRHAVETQNNRLQTTCECLAVASKQESCRDSIPSSIWQIDPNLQQSAINPVLGKNLEHPRLTR